MPNELRVSRFGDQVWSALLARGRPLEFRVDLGDPGPRVRQIFGARVVATLPEIDAVFVDLGSATPAFLHTADLPAGSAPPREGQTLRVQVVREALGDKRPRVSGKVGLPGGLLVFLPGQSATAVSRRVRDPATRAALQERLAGLAPRGSGFIARTASVDAPQERLVEEARSLVERWARIERADTVGLLWDGARLWDRLLLDLASREVERIVTDDAADFERGSEWLARTAPDLVPRLSLRKTGPVFRDDGLFVELDRALNREVRLPSGGRIVIDETEALVAIDVNSAGSRIPPLEVNLEAVAEAARQLRLRDLGGQVVIDCIELRETAAWGRVERTLHGALTTDPSRTRIHPVPELGLLLLTRERSRPSLGASLTESCDRCSGRRWRPRAVAGRVRAALRQARSDGRAARSLAVHPEVARELAAAGESDPAPVLREDWRVERFELR